MQGIKNRRRGANGESPTGLNGTFLTSANSTSPSFHSYLERNKKLAPVSKQLTKERRLILSVIEEKRIAEHKIARIKLEVDRSENF